MEMESICGETMPFCKKNYQQIMNYVFDNDDKFSFLMIDMSLKETNKFRYFKKFNEIFITNPSDGDVGLTPHTRGFLRA
jgi:hypothetical protein